jgi:hypothetical protein
MNKISLEGKSYKFSLIIYYNLFEADIGGIGWFLTRSRFVAHPPKIHHNELNINSGGRWWGWPDIDKGQQSAGLYGGGERDILGWSRGRDIFFIAVQGGILELFLIWLKRYKYYYDKISNIFYSIQFCIQKHEIILS